jgi:hypothetical protein
VAGLATLAGATVVVHETIDDMARRVPFIVHGRVVRSVAGWDEDKSRIWTWTEVAVVETIKGKPAPLVLVKQPGGEVGPIGQQVAGAATFREGEEVVLFLEPAPDEAGVFRPSGLSAGKVSFVEWRGRSAAVRDLKGLAFATPGGKRVDRVDGPEFLGAPETFLARLRELAKGGAR